MEPYSVCMCVYTYVYMWTCECVNSFLLHNILWGLSKDQTLTPKQTLRVEIIEPQMNLLTLLCSCESQVQSHLTFFTYFNKNQVT